LLTNKELVYENIFFFFTDSILRLIYCLAYFASLAKRSLRGQIFKKTTCPQRTYCKTSKKASTTWAVIALFATGHSNY